MNHMAFLMAVGLGMAFWTAYQITLDQVYIPRHSHKPLQMSSRRPGRKAHVWVSRSRAPYRFWSAILGQAIGATVFLGLAVYKLMN